MADLRTCQASMRWWATNSRLCSSPSMAQARLLPLRSPTRSLCPPVTERSATLFTFQRAMSLRVRQYRCWNRMEEACGAFEVKHHSAGDTAVIELLDAIVTG